MKYILFVFFVILISWVYLPWFTIGKTLSSGDWPYLYKENINEFSLLIQPPFLWLDPYYQLTAKIGSSVFFLPWEIIEKIFWFYPFLVISIFSSWKFTKFSLEKLGVKENLDTYSAVGSFLYTANTYILMIVGGGQMGIAMAYAFVPLVMVRLIQFVGYSSVLGQEIKNQSFDKLRTKIKNTIQNSKLLKSIFITSLIFAIQLMFDPRVFLITLFGFFIYVLFSWIANKSIDFTKIINLVFVIIIAAILNLFWIIPNIAFFQNIYTEAAIAANVEFLSFASFSNSFSLLHPNWPENVFGKTYFMRPEFLILPILAFSSLLFLNESKVKSKKSKVQFKIQNFSNLTIEQFNNRAILFFALLGLLSAFLAKGINPPFGEVYLWASNIPGAAIFRDPTKFYLLVVLSYSVLIPFSVYAIYNWLKSRTKFSIFNFQFSIKSKIFNLQNIFLIITFLHLIFLIRPAILGQLGGTFKPQIVPDEYITFKNYLMKESDFANILWIPQRQRFGINLENYPGINLQDIIQEDSISDLVLEFKNDRDKIINDYEIRYVVVPYDSKGDIFLTDRKYDESLYRRTVGELEKISWLKRIVAGKNGNFGRIAVYEVLTNMNI